VLNLGNFSANSGNRANLNFGKIIPIKKVVVDGQETTNYKDRLYLACDLDKVLQHDGEHQNGWLIRHEVTKMTGDYTAPSDPGMQTAESKVYVSPKIAYLATGKDADTFSNITYFGDLHCRAVIDARIQEEANKPGVQIEGNKGLVLYGTRVPMFTNEGLFEVPQLTHIDFSA